MKHEGFATAFERLDRDLLRLRRQVALGSAVAWNWQSCLDAHLARRAQRLRRLRFGRRWRELVVAMLAVAFALVVAA